jgi:hypothetical protein
MEEKMQELGVDPYFRCQLMAGVLMHCTVAAQLSAPKSRVDPKVIFDWVRFQ